MGFDTLWFKVWIQVMSTDRGLGTHQAGAEVSAWYVLCAHACTCIFNAFMHVWFVCWLVCWLVCWWLASLFICMLACLPACLIVLFVSVFGCAVYMVHARGMTAACLVFGVVCWVVVLVRLERPVSHLILLYLRFQGLDFERKHADIVVNASRDHLRIWDMMSRLSIETPGILR